MNKPHKHAELIKAWADGAEIEEKHNDGIWMPFKDGHWMEADAWKYRIKPEPKPDVVRSLCLTFSRGYIDNVSLADPNLKLTFDGETGKLKAAEVMQ